MMGLRNLHFDTESCKRHTSSSSSENNNPTVQSLTLSSFVGQRGFLHWLLGFGGPTTTILKVLGVTGFQLQLQSSLCLGERKAACIFKNAPTSMQLKTSSLQ